MAKAKKAAKGSGSKAKIPAGFTQVDDGGSFGSGSHDFQKHKILQGTVVSVDTVKVSDPDNKSKKIPRRVMRVKNGDNVTSSVWESFQLKGLFDAAKKGKQVYIQFLGQKKIGKKRLNEFATAIK